MRMRPPYFSFIRCFSLLYFRLNRINWGSTELSVGRIFEVCTAYQSQLKWTFFHWCKCISLHVVSISHQNHRSIIHWMRKIWYSLIWSAFVLLYLPFRWTMPPTSMSVYMFCSTVFRSVFAALCMWLLFQKLRNYLHSSSTSPMPLNPVSYSKFHLEIQNENHFHLIWHRSQAFRIATTIHWNWPIFGKGDDDLGLCLFEVYAYFDRVPCIDC